MAEMIDFFQNEAQECRKLAARATEKKDREFWLRLGQRWEWLLQQNGGSAKQAVRPPRSRRSVLEKRFARRHAA